MEEKLDSVFGITDLENVTVEGGDSVFIEGLLRKERACPKCGSNHLHCLTRNHRIFLLPPVCGKAAKVQVLVQKRKCVTCGSIWWPKVPFSKGKQRMTQSFVNYALDLLKFGTIKDVAAHLGVNWNVIKGMHKEYLANEYQDIDMSEVEHVSIDEFSIAKRHKYMTTIMDIKTGRILFAVEGRKKKDVEPVLRELKKKPLSL